jgi:hypothetical protein
MAAIVSGDRLGVRTMDDAERARLAAGFLVDLAACFDVTRAPLALVLTVLSVVCRAVLVDRRADFAECLLI